ncbi:hypothetical protein RAZWK3B_15468 [Roseobacter sp. AzwK-3b]|nr:hypothetical protein RAZWK3B_15468 [Roseobacter sp. AzwK-3b]
MQLMKQLLDDIKEYCAEREMSLSTFGFHAAKDGKFVARLEKGGRCWPETEAAVRAFMAENPPEKMGSNAHD